MKTLPSKQTINSKTGISTLSSVTTDIKTRKNGVPTSLKYVICDQKTNLPVASGVSDNNGDWSVYGLNENRRYYIMIKNDNEEEGLNAAIADWLKPVLVPFTYDNIIPFAIYGVSKSDLQVASSPLVVSADGGVILYIHGTGIDTNATVLIGDLAPNYVDVRNNNLIRIILPSGSGTKNITVTNSNGDTRTLINAITYKDLWTPEIIARDYWYKFNDVNNITYNSDATQYVSVENKAPTNAIYSQANTSHRPDIDSETKLNMSMVCDNASWLENEANAYDVNSSNTGTFYTVFLKQRTSTQLFPLCDDINLYRSPFYYPSDQRIYSGFGNDRLFRSGATYTNLSEMMCIITRDKDELKLRVNGENVLTFGDYSAITPIANDGILSSIGRSNNNISSNALLYEIFLSSKKLHVDEILRIEGYIAHEHDLTHILPADHIYKNDPPTIPIAQVTSIGQNEIYNDMIVNIHGDGFTTSSTVAFGNNDSIEVTVKNDHEIIAIADENESNTTIDVTLTLANGSVLTLENAITYVGNTSNFVVTGGNTSTVKLFLIDNGDYEEVSSIDISPYQNIRSLTYDSNTQKIWVTASNNSNTRLLRIDYDKDNYELTSFEVFDDFTATEGFGTARIASDIHNSMLYLLGSSSSSILRKIDVSNTAAPTIVASTNTDGDPRQLKLCGHEKQYIAYTSGNGGTTVLLDTNDLSVLDTYSGRGIGLEVVPGTNSIFVTNGSSNTSHLSVSNGELTLIEEGPSPASADPIVYEKRNRNLWTGSKRTEWDGSFGSSKNTFLGANFSLFRSPYETSRWICGTASSGSILWMIDMNNPEKYSQLQSSTIGTIKDIHHFNERVEKPIITNIIPTTGRVNESTNHTLYGTGFKTNVSVLFNGVPASNVNLVNKNIITFSTPVFANTDTVDVKVLNQNGSNTVLVDGFQFLAPGEWNPSFIEGATWFDTTEVAYRTANATHITQLLDVNGGSNLFNSTTVTLNNDATVGEVAEFVSTAEMAANFNGNIFGMDTENRREYFAWFVFYPTSASNNATIHLNTRIYGDNSNHGAFIKNVSGNIEIHGYLTSDGDAFALAPGLNDWIIGSHEYSDGFVRVRVNGGQEFTDRATGQGPSSDTIRLGGRNYTGKIAMFGYLKDPPDELTRQRIEGWAAHKLGLESKLPADHPYKNSPP